MVVHHQIFNSKSMNVSPALILSQWSAYYGYLLLCSFSMWNRACRTVMFTWGNNVPRALFRPSSLHLIFAELNLILPNRTDLYCLCIETDVYWLNLPIHYCVCSMKSLLSTEWNWFLPAWTYLYWLKFIFINWSLSLLNKIFESLREQGLKLVILKKACPASPMNRCIYFPDNFGTQKFSAFLHVIQIFVVLET